jgi:hypothetical protein
MYYTEREQRYRYLFGKLSKNVCEEIDKLRELERKQMMRITRLRRRACRELGTHPMGDP